MNCSNCGGVLSLKGTHCLTCRKPVVYGQQQQNGPSFPIYQATRSVYGPPPAIQQSPSLNHGQAVAPLQSRSVPLSVARDSASPATGGTSRRRGIIILGVIVGLLLLTGIGALFLPSTGNGTQSSTPSSGGVDATASTIIIHPQTSSGVDTQLTPTNVSTTFTANQKIYLTFGIKSSDQDGYIKVKWFADGQSISTTSFKHVHANTSGVFSITYITPTMNGLAELYWCGQADCNDGQLAQVVHFTIKPVSMSVISVRRAISAVH